MLQSLKETRTVRDQVCEAQDEHAEQCDGHEGVEDRLILQECLVALFAAALFVFLISYAVELVLLCYQQFNVDTE